MSLVGDGEQLLDADRSRGVARRILRELISDETTGFSNADRERVAAVVMADVLGLGMVDLLLDTPSVTDVVINGDGSVWFERHGRLERHAETLEPHAVARLVDRTADAIGRRADRRRPVLDGTPRPGVRATIVVPPIAHDGAVLAFRRHDARVVDLGAFGNSTVVDRLRQLVERRLNVVVAGPTGSGKTTLAAALLADAPDAERIVVIEDTPELPIRRSSSIRMIARPGGADGVAEVTMAQLVRAALRLRPDRIVLGEVRGVEAFDMVWAMSTGHSGCLSTCHAIDAVGLLNRLVAFVLTARPELRVDVTAEMVAAAVDAVVIVERGVDGQRRVSEIVEREPGEPRRGWHLAAGWQVRS